MQVAGSIRAGGRPATLLATVRPIRFLGSNVNGTVPAATAAASGIAVDTAPRTAAATSTRVPRVRTNKSPASEIMKCYSELGKARLSALVVGSTAAGFMLAGAPLALDTFAAVAVGTSLAAASANTWNQIYEIRTDKLMHRTKMRPLPSGRISTMHAVAFGTATGLSSVGLLAAYCNPLTAALGAANIVLYAGVYTPLKQFHVSNTWVGAVVGAIPPLMGYAAATGTIATAEAGIMSAGLFLWQFPHFFALAWNIKKDYALGNHKMIPCFDATGAKTAGLITRYSLALSALPFASVALGVSSPMFAVESLAFNSYLLYTAYQFNQKPSQAAAKKVFRCSLWYLPLFLTLMVFHKTDWDRRLVDGSSSSSGAVADQSSSSPWMTKVSDDVQSSILHGKEVMRDLCVHEWFSDPTTTTVTDADGVMTQVPVHQSELLARDQSRNKGCPLSMSSGKIDKALEDRLTLGASPNPPSVAVA